MVTVRLQLKTSLPHILHSIPEIELIYYLHCSVIIGRNPIEANANTGAIQLPGNPLVTIGNPLAVIGKLTMEAKGFLGSG